jgi:hypothetical protein
LKKILFLLIFIGLQLNGQELFYRILDSDNGLPSNKVHYIFEDSKGYIWFGTENGVARWDSKNWFYYSIKDGLPNNEVLYIFEDSKRRIWFSTFSNELCYLKNDTIFNRKNDKRLEKIIVSKGTQIYEFDRIIFFFNEDKFNEIFLQGLNIEDFKNTFLKKSYLGKCKVTKYNNKFLLYRNNNNNNTSNLLYNDNLYSFFNEQIYIDENKRINVFDIKNNVCYNYDLHNFLNKAANFCGTKLSIGNKFPIFGSLKESDNYVKLMKKKNRINKNYNYFARRIFISPNIGNIVNLANFKNKLYFTFKNEVWNTTEKLIKLNEDIKNTTSLKQIFLLTLKNRIIFISSLNTYNSSKNEVDRDIHKIYKYKDNIRMLDENSYILDLSFKTISKLPNKEKIYGLNFGHDDKLYITSSKSILNIETNKSITNSYNNILCFFKGFHYSPKNKLYTINNSNQGLYIQYLNKKAIKISNLYTYTSYIDSRDRIWIGTINKLFIANTFLPKVMGEKEVKLNNKLDVFCSEIKEDNKGNIFFTTNDGVYIIDKQNRKYHLSDKNYLSSNELVTLKLDPLNQSFFVASRNGVNQIKYKEKNGILEFEVANKFFKDDGLSSNEIKDILIDGDSLWVATAKGLDLITNKRFRPDTLIIPIHINRVYVNDSIWRLDSSYQLKHDQNNIKIDYSAIYYQRRDRLDIRYRLIEDEDTTSGTVENSVLHLFSLAPGKYTLQLYVYDKDYPYIKSDFKKLNFQISPPYYKTGWFYTLIILLTSLILTYILRIRYIRDKEKLEFKNKRLELEKNLSKLKLEALKAEMNPHFIFNCLNSIKDFILREETEKSQYYLSQLSKLIRIALYNTKEEFISLRSEIEFIELYIELEQLRFQEKFVFKKIIVDENLLNAEVPTMVLQPFFENAIRHGKIGQLDYEGKILLEVRQENDFIVFNIKDNGIGLSKAAEIKSKTESGHKSMAIDIIKDRIKIYNQSFNLDISLEINEIHDIEYKTEVILKYILD